MILHTKTSTKLFSVQLPLFHGQFSKSGKMLFTGQNKQLYNITGNLYSICRLFVLYLVQLNNNDQLLDEIEHYKISNAGVWVICRSRRPRQITQTRGLIIHNIMLKPNSVTVLSSIFGTTCKIRTLSLIF